MDYDAIDRFMKRTGLANEPAFDFLHIMNEPIPSPETRKILGLYYPDGDEAKDGFGYLPPSTMILPPDADVSTLLHELGHRYGHFYYDDLTEAFAESYSAWIAHGKGTGWSIFEDVKEVVDGFVNLGK